MLHMDAETEVERLLCGLILKSQRPHYGITYRKAGTLLYRDAAAHTQSKHKDTSKVMIIMRHLTLSTSLETQSRD